MTPEEERALLADLEHIEACYASQPEPEPPPEDWEDEDDTLRRAALNCGQP
jgi:hypothetical protein